MNEEQNITIRIANQKPIALTIKRDDEEIIRKAERDVNTLWTQWCKRFSDKTPAEVLAMVAFQFARYYYVGQSVRDRVGNELSDFERELDALLAATEAADPASRG